MVEVITSEINRETDKEATWYLVGALGDGTLYYDNGRYVVEYGQKCVEWLNLAISLRLEKLGYKPVIVRHRVKYWKLKVYSKDLYEELRTLRGIVPGLVYFAKFCKGLFDAEGSVIYQDAKRVCVRISQMIMTCLKI